MRARRLLCSAVLAAGYAPADAGPAPIVIRDSLGIRIVENDLTCLIETCAVSAQPRVTIGVAEGEEAYELYRVFGAARLSDGRIVLVNQGTQQIRFYDREGRFLSAAGRAGGGPGEFRNAFHLWILPGDTIAAGNYRPGLPDTLGIFPHGRRGQVDPDPASVWLFPLFESCTRVAAGGSRVVLGHGATAELMVYDMEGAPQREMLVRWTAGDRVIGAEDIGAERCRLVSDDGGRFQCRVTLPNIEGLLEAGAVHVLGEGGGELDVERVLEYSRAPPGAPPVR